MMRWLFIDQGRYENFSRPHLVLEPRANGSRPKKTRAERLHSLGMWEALDDPRYWAAALAWQAGDDTAAEEDEARFDTECEAEQILEGFG